MPRFWNEGRDGRSERSTGARSDGTEDVASGVSSNTRQMSFRGARPEPCFDRALISERQRGGDLMAFNLTRGDTRPILIGLAIVALFGWGLFIYAELHGAAQNQKARQQISRLSTSEESFKTQLAQQQQASGSLADLQTRIPAATDQARQATAARDQAQAELASGQKELEAQRQQQAQVVQQLQAQTQQLSQVHRQLGAGLGGEGRDG